MGLTWLDQRGELALPYMAMWERVTHFRAGQWNFNASAVKVHQPPYLALSSSARCSLTLRRCIYLFAFLFSFDCRR